MSHNCFKLGCELEVKYVCLCLSSQTYSYEFHLQMHLKLPNRIHNFDSIFAEPSEGTKCAILEFLSKQKSKKEKLKKIALASTHKYCYKNRDSIDENLRRLNYGLKEISSLIKKISKFSEKEESSSLNPLNLQQEIESKRNEVLTNDLDPCRSLRLFLELSQLRNKKYEILNRSYNERETEQEFRRICSLYENRTSNKLFRQTYQEYISTYQKITSTYLFNIYNNERINLFIYDTEREIEEWKFLENPEEELCIDYIVQLPSDELFIINYNAYIIDKNYRFRLLPSAKVNRCNTSIYFNRSVYCFWVVGAKISSSRFDLNKYRWVDLTETYYEYEYRPVFDCVIYNGNIVISDFDKCNLLLYSIDIDSFSEIPYKFLKNRRKILINGEERLYVIESDKGWIYECESGDEYAWKKIANSIIDFYPDQVYCSYNKGGVYISLLQRYEKFRVYFKYDLSKKTLTEIACYGENLAIKRLDEKIEAIECYGQDFKFNSDHISAYIQKRFTLSCLVYHLETIERYNELGAKNQADYWSKGASLQALGRHFEALDCYNEWIKFISEQNDFDNQRIPLLNKAYILYDLGRHLEALECYNKLIELDPNDKNYYMKKADSLYDLGRCHEAIECYNELIKFKPEYEYPYIRKADTLYNMGENLKAVKYFNKAIKLNPDNPLYFCYHANMLNDLGEVAEAIQEFNKAYDLFSVLIDYDDCDSEKDGPDGTLVKDYLELLKMFCKLLESAIEFKEKVDKIKNSNISSSEIINEIEKKEKVIKEKHSQLLKRAVKCIDWKRTESIEKIEIMKIEIAEHQKEIIDAFAQLPLLLLSIQD